MDAYRRAAWLAGSQASKDIRYVIHFNMGTMHQERGHSAAALGEFSQAAEADGARWEAFYNIGLCLIALEAPLAAVPPLERASQGNPREAATFLHLGIARMRGGYRRSAEQAFQEAIRLRPSIEADVKVARGAEPLEADPSPPTPAAKKKGRK